MATNISYKYLRRKIYFYRTVDCTTQAIPYNHVFGNEPYWCIYVFFNEDTLINPQTYFSGSLLSFAFFFKCLKEQDK